MISRGVEVTAPGKINLILRILDRRPDHHHNLWSIMRTVELADTIVVEADPSTPHIDLSCEGAELSVGPENLVYRAAAAALKRIGRPGGLRIHIHKRVPIAAGMGGGSSDAAATIRALAALFETGWSATQMSQIGRDIGSDVPFFFYGPTALVEGRGERVSPLQCGGGGWVVLVNPNISISTAWAYEKVATARAAAVGRDARTPPLVLPPGAQVDWQELLRGAENDFAPVIEEVHPVLREIRQHLARQGAQAALLAGSGATVFGVFPSQSAAETAAFTMKDRGWRTWITRTCEHQDRPRPFN